MLEIDPQRNLEILKNIAVCLEAITDEMRIAAGSIPLDRPEDAVCYTGSFVIRAHVKDAQSLYEHILSYALNVVGFKHHWRDVSFGYDFQEGEQSFRVLQFEVTGTQLVSVLN